MEDAELIDLFFARNESAISETQTKYGTYCLYIATSILSSPQDAEEVENDVYLALWNSIPPHRPQNLKAYIARVTRNTALNKLKRQSRIKRGKDHLTEITAELSEVIPYGTDPQDELDGIELSRLISRFLCGRTEAEKKVFIQRYFYLFTIKALCTENGLSKGKVISMLGRIRRDLSDFLREEGYSI